MPTTLKQRINGILVYARHSATCKHADDSGHVKCGCPLWLQWQEDGKPVQRSAKTRSITQGPVRKVRSGMDQPWGNRAQRHRFPADRRGRNQCLDG
jgi:hypothetical protein